MSRNNKSSNKSSLQVFNKTAPCSKKIRKSHNGVHVENMTRQCGSHKKNMESRKIDIKDLTKKELARWLEEKGIRSFRADQIFKWVYLCQVDGFDEMTNLGKNLRTTLDKHFTLDRLHVEKIEISKDGSRKYLFRLFDDRHIESVLIPEKNHHTLCISTQVGCAQRCVFCMTAKGGFTRNLTSGEIIAQVRDILNDTEKAKGKPLTNIVFMGMGEPLANYDHLIKSIDIITDGDFGLKISARRVTVSTAGLVPKMDRLGKDTKVNLAVSLNAADNETRSRLMPVNDLYPVEQLIAACKNYPLAPRRKITFEYILMDTINDSIEHAEQLARLLRPVKAKINLIPFNDHEKSRIKRPSKEKIEAFQNYLIKQNYTVMIRKSKGQDISAACGQLKARLLNHKFSGA